MKLPQWAEEELKKLIGNEYRQLCQSFDAENTTYIRVNTLVTNEKELKKILEAKGFVLEKKMENSFRVVESPYSAGASIEYLQGYYYVQDYTSMFPILELEPKPGEFVLDMAAAPGGKTTHLAELMKNKGVIVALDINNEKIKALKSNIQRMHVENVIAIRTDALKFNCSAKFDKILLDAPCTGSGVLRKDKNRAITLSKEDTEKYIKIQKELVNKAYSLLKNNGTLVYSTCSFLRQENEDIVDYASTLGLKEKMNKRFFTHRDDSQCFFYSKLVKI